MATKRTDLRDFTDGSQHSLLYAQRADGTIGAVWIDDMSHGMVHINHEHHEIHAGDAFRYSDPITLSAGISQDYLFTVPNSTKWPHFTFSLDGTAITTVEMFRATDKIGTTLQPVFNANDNSATVAGMTIHKGVAGGATDGVSIFKHSSGTATGSSKSEGVGLYATERVLKQNTKYLLRVTSGTVGNLINLHAEWYEHTSIS